MPAAMPAASSSWVNIPVSQTPVRAKSKSKSPPSAVSDRPIQKKDVATGVGPAQQQMKQMPQEAASAAEPSKTQGNEPEGGGRRRGKKNDTIKGVSNIIKYNHTKNDPYYIR